MYEKISPVWFSDRDINFHSQFRLSQLLEREHFTSQPLEIFWSLVKNLVIRNQNDRRRNYTFCWYKKIKEKQKIKERRNW